DGIGDTAPQVDELAPLDVETEPRADVAVLGEVAHECVTHALEAGLDDAIDVHRPLLRSRSFPGQIGGTCQDHGMAAPPVDAALLDEAVALARDAGAHTLRWFGADDLAVDRKADGTPVTEADRATEALVRARLAAAHPHDAIIGEEDRDHAGTSGRRW